MRAQRAATLLFLIVAAFFASVLPSYGESGSLFALSEDGESGSFYELYEDGESGLLVPEDENGGISAAIPEEYALLFEKDGEFSLPDLPFFLRFALEELQKSLRDHSLDLGLFCGCILLCSIFTLLEECLRGGNSRGILRLCVLFSGCLCIASALRGLFSVASTHLSKLSSFLGSMIPAVTGAALAMGAAADAAVSGSALTVILALIGQFAGGILLPLLQVVPVFGLVSLLTDNKGLSALSDTLRSLFLTVLGALCTLLVTVFAFQHAIAAKADSLSLRAFRFTAGNLIPLVGSAFSESSKTLLAGLGLLRVTTGAVGVAVVLLMVVPPLCILLAAHFSFKLARSFAEAAGNPLLRALFSCGVSASGGLAALVAVCDLCAIVAFAVTMTATTV